MRTRNQTTFQKALADIGAAFTILSWAFPPRKSPLTPEQLTHLESFDHIWATIRNQPWDPQLGDLVNTAVGISVGFAFLSIGLFIDHISLSIEIFCVMP
jgi:hypothetical protein